MRIRSTLFALALLVATPSAAEQLFVQLKDTDAVLPLPQMMRAQLGDPFFNLVLKEQSDVRDLDQIEKLIQPDPDKRQLFVVSEMIAHPGRSQRHRAVLSFTGRHPEGEVLEANVMLSVEFDSEAFPERANNDPQHDLPFIEAWGWDNHRGHYNYYKLDGNPMTWKFRGSSDSADFMSPSDRAGSCMACHINGAPIMKELLLPWNHWQSGEQQIEHLNRLSANPWPVTSDPRFRSLQGAEMLEEKIIASVRNFTTRRINRGLKRNNADGDITVDENGKQTIVEGRRLLRHLFETTEYNIISARNMTNWHPIPHQTNGRPAVDVQIPDSFFLNANLISGGGSPGFKGLNLMVHGFAKSANAVVTPDEYVELVRNTTVADVPGDAVFAWLIPEPSQIDNETVDQLMTRGILPAPYVAAVLAIDLENPILSEERGALFRFVPDQFSFEPLDKIDQRFDLRRFRNHELTTATIAALEASLPVSGSPEARFLLRLKDPDPISRLSEDIAAYQERLRLHLDSADPNTRVAELARLYGIAQARRQAVIQHPVLGSLDETEGRLLFPR